MSKTTLRKRIALTAVTAIGAGLLSVVPVSTAGAVNNNAAGSSSNPAAANALLNIGVVASTNGKVTLTAASAAGAPTAATSVGLVSVGDIGTGRQEGTTQTAVLLSTGTITVYTTMTGVANSQFITVTGGTIAEAANADGINSSSTVAGNVNANENFIVALKPSSGQTSMVIRLYDAATTTYSSVNAATALATGLIAPTLGTLTGQVTVTIAPTSSAGVMSPALSNLYTVTPDGNDNAQTSDTPTAAVRDNGQFGCVNIQLNDAYGTNIATTSGLLTATATNGAILAFGTTACAAGTASGAGSTFSTADPSDAVLSIAQPTAGAPLSTTVTISYNNVVVGTKSFVIRGKVSKVTVSSPKIAALNATTASTATVKFEDAAGNTVYPVAGSAIYPLSSTVFGITA